MSRRGDWSEERKEHDRKVTRDRRRAQREGTYVPNPVRGPSGVNPGIPDPHIREGLELAGTSTLVKSDGAPTAQWQMARRAGADLPPFEIPPTFTISKTTVMVSGDGATRIQHIAFDHALADRWVAFKEAVAEVCAGIEPLPPVPAPPRVTSDYMSVLAVGDLHWGMLAYAPETGTHHDLAIALRDFRVVTRTLIDRAPACERFVLALLGDVFHAQDDNQKTPRSGHKLDVDSRFQKIWRKGLAAIRDAIDYALAKFGRVRVLYVPGNHDPHMAYMVASNLEAWYRNEPRVDIDPATGPFAYEQFGETLLGFAHGPSVTRLERLPGVMQTDRGAAWGLTRYHRWHTGDVHHDTLKEYSGVMIESHGIITPKDAWANESGYRAEQAMKLITYHRKYGEKNRERVTIEEARDLLAQEEAT